MALTDQVVMPGSDYQAICDATRSLTGTTGTLKSGEIADKILSGSPNKTWIFKLVTTKTINDGVITFTSLNRYHTFIAQHQNLSNTLTAILGGANNTDTCCLTYTSAYDTLSTTSFVVSYDNTSKIYTYTWNLSSSSSEDWYEGTISIYAC